MKLKSYEMNLETFALPLERFSMHGDSLTACDSDLRNHRFDGTYRYIQRLYNDAADEGIAIRSHKTGNIERFLLTNIMKDDEGDLQGFEFKALNKFCRIQKVTIFND